MTPVDIFVLTASTALSLFILYYFFGPKKETVEATATKNIQVATIVVDGAFVPSDLELKTNVPAEITFDRRDHGECTDWVVFNRFPNQENQEIKSYLPEGKKTTVKFTPTQTGNYGFACGMGMNHGRLVIKK